MKKFFKDYAELCKISGKFYKEHWLGCIVLNVILIVGEYLWFFRKLIKERITKKFRKEEKKEESE